MFKCESPVLMIASGMYGAKKKFLLKPVESFYLNFPLLGLATQLYNKGYQNVKMIQGDQKSMNAVFEEIREAGIDVCQIKYPVLISVPSFFAIDWANDFIAVAKQKNPDLKFVVGGRWVINANYDWINKKMPNVDFFCMGCPDDAIDQLLYPNNWDKYKNALFASDRPFSNLNYQLLNNFKSYQPSIEVSRGCPHKCDYCYEKDNPLWQEKYAEDLILEANDICKLYGNDSLNFYFEASIFNPSIEWSESFLHNYEKTGAKFGWRFGTRVDTVNPVSVEILSRAGLKVIDLGFESASPKQLDAMGKTQTPDTYLSKAEILLNVMGKAGVWAKLNILLYPGETNLTIAQTTEWLDKQKQNIKGVSVNPLFIYLYGEGTYDFVKKIELATGVTLNTKLLYERGYVSVPLSLEISIEEAEKICKQISDSFMSTSDYTDLKKVCYTKI